MSRNKSLIEMKNLFVELPIYENSHRSFKNKMLNLTTGGRIASGVGKYPFVRAIDDCSISIQHGEKVGLVGHNGSGKSTLLRVLAGVYSPVRGELKIDGRLASLLDVSMGLDPDATGIENIYLRGVMDGLSPSIIRRKLDDIVKFTELGDYLGLPVRTYSSGMTLRLAFGISTSVDADILLMDEWLSVGDADFSAKATERLKSIVDKAGILVIASHDINLLNNICSRIITLEHGKVIKDEIIAGS
jgi:lipopolysaccharide transport system ATP-binding protein